MQVNQNRDNRFSVLSQATAYLLGGIFLLTTSSTAGMTMVQTRIGQVFGGAFITFAFFLVIASYFGVLTAWADGVRVKTSLFFVLLPVTMARLIKAAADSQEPLYFVLAFAFLVLILVSFLLHTVRAGIDLATREGRRIAVKKILIGLSVALSLFAFAMFIMQVDSIGGPTLYLILSVICLSISSLW